MAAAYTTYEPFFCPEIEDDVEVTVNVLPKRAQVGDCDGVRRCGVQDSRGNRLWEKCCHPETHHNQAKRRGRGLPTAPT